MFLGWLNQILACIDTEKATAVEDILLRIGTSFSNALMLPFHFTQERIKSKSGRIGDKTKNMLRRLVLF